MYIIIIIYLVNIPPETSPYAGFSKLEFSTHNMMYIIYMKFNMKICMHFSVMQDVYNIEQKHRSLNKFHLI